MADNSGYLGLAGSTPQDTTKTGADFTGADGAANRTLAISTGTSGFEVWINGRVLHLTDEYTYDGITLTIIPPLDDTDKVQIQSFGVV